MRFQITDILDLELTNQNTIDIVGTGGDGLNTINISTISAILLSHMGYQVAKHGNRSNSGICGSADLVVLLGYDLESKYDNQKKFNYLFAPKYNPAFKFTKAARNIYQKPTFFNLLGPLLNPLKPKNMVIGISNKIIQAIPNAIELIEFVLTLSNTNYIIIVGEMDELSLFHESQILFRGAEPLKFNSNELLKLLNLNLSNLYINEIIINSKADSALKAKNIIAKKGTITQKLSVAINIALALVLLEGEITDTEFYNNFIKNTLFTLDYLEAKTQPQLKICGVKTQPIIDLCASLKITYLGFNFVKTSSRYISADDFKKLRLKNSNFKPITVGIFMDQSLNEVAELSKLVDVVQLHGRESPEYVQNLRSLIPNKIWKAFTVWEDKIVNWEAYTSFKEFFEPWRLLIETKIIDNILLDIPKNEHDTNPSLNATKLFREIAQTIHKKPVIAGGINITNIESYVESYNPDIIDICSGVESEKGYKEERLIQEINQKIKHYA